MFRFSKNDRIMFTIVRFVDGSAHESRVSHLIFGHWWSNDQKTSSNYNPWSTELVAGVTKYFKCLSFSWFFFNELQNDFRIMRTWNQIAFLSMRSASAVIQSNSYRNVLARIFNISRTIEFRGETFHSRNSIEWNIKARRL